jgi:hypothetical protein
VKRRLLAICLITISSSVSYSQRGKIKIGAGADLIIPASGALKLDSKTGFGGYLKGLYGIGKAGQVSFTTGYLNLPQKDPSRIFGYTSTFRFVPLLLGYRQIIKGFYVEPQTGLSVNHSNYKTPFGSTHFTGVSFTLAAGLGYAIHNVDIGIRFQGHPVKGRFSSTYFWGFHLGYNFHIK